MKEKFNITDKNVTFYNGQLKVPKGASLADLDQILADTETDVILNWDGGAWEPVVGDALHYDMEGLDTSKLGDAVLHGTINMPLFNKDEDGAELCYTDANGKPQDVIHFEIPVQILAELDP